MDMPGNKNETPIKNIQQQSAFGAISSFIFDLVKILVIALVIIVPFRMFIAEPFVVSGSSMLPTYHNRDYLIIDRLSYHTGSVQRGDVVVLKYPKDTSEFFIKRIIGLPGEKIRFQGGHVFIINAAYPDGLQLNESYLPSQTETFAGPQTIELHDGEYYALGDNRTASSDSRVWGILPADDIVGKVWLRVFPVSRFEHIIRPTY